MKTACDRCGTCCRQGGPALHGEDRKLVLSGRLKFEDLITVRRGELAVEPLAVKPTPVKQEFLKIQGRGADWCCTLYDEESSLCTIYEDRPLACELLECWNPDAVLAITGQDLLTRFDCIGEEDPLLPVIRFHEEQCSCPDMHEIEEQLEGGGLGQNRLAELTAVVNMDLAIRERAIHDFGLSVPLELFYFGRPLFHLLAPLGIRCRESREKGLVLEYGRK